MAKHLKGNALSRLRDLGIDSPRKVNQLLHPDALDLPAACLLRIWLAAQPLSGGKKSLSQAKLATEVLGVSPTHLNSLVLGKSDRGKKLGIELEKLTGIAATSWS